MKDKLFILMLLFLLINKSFAHELKKGGLHLVILPKEASIFLDSVKIDNNISYHELSRGEHRINLSSKNMMDLDTTFVVDNANTKIFKYNMRYNADYYKYKVDLKNYRKKFFLNLIGIVTGVTATLISYNKSNDYYDKAILEKDRYPYLHNQDLIVDCKDAYKRNGAISKTLGYVSLASNRSHFLFYL